MGTFVGTSYAIIDDIHHAFNRQVPERVRSNVLADFLDRMVVPY